MIPLAPNNLGFSKMDSDELKVTWLQEATDLRPVERFLIIIKSCVKLPCDINPISPQPDEKRYEVSNDTFKLQQKLDTKIDLFGILICAENALGRNCTPSYNLEGATSIPPIGTEKRPDRTLIVLVVILCVPLVILVVCLLAQRKKKDHISRVRPLVTSIG